MTAVHIEHLSQRYGDRTALDDVSLTLPDGCTIGLVGPDGVGKSTLLSIIAGVRQVQAGHVSVLGGNLADKSFRIRLSSRVSFMPQGLGRNLYATLSVWENVDFFARLFGQSKQERKARIQRLLNATGLTPFSDRPAGKLSGGMKQKLGLCCALVHDPDLLILDEPTTGVDPLSRRQFWELVESLRSERAGMTIIVATAYMEEAERFEHLIAMDAGRILVSDATSSVLARTRAPSLEAAYVSLLPHAKRGDGKALIIPPYQRQEGPPAIEATGLTRRFGDFVAVNNVSFRIERGEIFGFLGSNGCGKTTTMKMLTGLLEVSGGEAKLLGKPVDSHDISTRARVGYMSQSFSLYEELTVRQNLALHAKLYQLSGSQARTTIEEGLRRFDLQTHADTMPSQLSLGIRQRLQLAAACLHKPEILILDEPTSGVDPAARDMFWRQLIALSRDERVTIFVSTHFMNEAERCDRISLMHRGTVLAVGSPQTLRNNKAAQTLENAFVVYLEETDGTIESARTTAASPAPSERESATQTAASQFTARCAPSGSIAGWLRTMWAFARREGMELRRDRIRITFALLGPIILLLSAAWSISFDIENVTFSVLDHDQSYESRRLIEHFAGSRYFQQTVALKQDGEIVRSLQSHAVSMVIDIPPGFGKDLVTGRRPEVGFYIDGALPFVSQNIQGYIIGIMLEYAQRVAKETPGLAAENLPALPIKLEPRFTYNQEFRSVYAIVPGLFMLCLILVPTMLTALGIVREKELGSITNLYASPASVGQFLIGKQLPYVALAMLSYLTLVFLSITLLHVPLKGNFIGFSAGALCFIFAATALGLMISTFFSSQVAAIFATFLICLIPSLNFSGFLYPVSTMTGPAWWIGKSFPSSWFQTISLGAMTKGLGPDQFLGMYAALIGFGLAYLVAARLFVRKQEL